MLSCVAEPFGNEMSTEAIASSNFISIFPFQSTFQTACSISAARNKISTCILPYSVRRSAENTLSGSLHAINTGEIEHEKDSRHTETRSGI